MKKLFLLFSLVLIFNISSQAQTPPNMSTAGNYALLSGDSIISSDSAIIVGYAGATSSVSSKVGGGTIYTGGTTVSNALSDLSTAMAYCTAQSGTTVSGTLGGQSLAAGVYKISGNAILNGTLTLTGDTTAIYIFNITDSLIVQMTGEVFRGDVKPENIFWNIGKSAVIEAGVSMSGIIMAMEQSSIDNVNSGFASLFCLENILISRTLDMPGDNVFYSKDFLATIPSLKLPTCATAPPCNLICNPSFELTNPGICTTSWAGIALGYSVSWSNPTSAATPDIYNTCNTNGMDIPTNNIGFQTATGTPANGYAGLVPRAIGMTNYREYLKGNLTTNLSPGVCYYFEMQVSAADKVNVAVVELGAAFTSINYILAGWAPLPLVPQVENTAGLLTSCTAWTTISGTFTAAGGENKVYIGNFHNDATTTTGGYTPCMTPASTNTYYYIDNLNLGVFSVDAGLDATICAGQSTPLMATMTSCGSLGFTYTWTPATGLSSASVANPTASPLTTTTYTVTVSAPGGSCSVTDAVTVFVNPKPNVVVNSPAICIGQTANLTASGASNYTWSAGVSPTTGANVTTTPSSTTSYTVTGTNTSTGCTNTAVATVTVNPLPVVTVNSPTICNGQPATLTAAGAVNYVWSTGAIINPISVSPTTTTTYTVTGYSAAGCSASVVATVTVNPLPVVTVNSPTICTGFAATLTAIGGTTYSWSTGAVINPISVSPTTTTSYTVTGTTTGCTGTAVATVTVNPLPSVTVNSPIICIGQTASLTASGASTYTWSAGATPTGVNTANASPIVTTTYTVIGTNTLTGCTNTAVSTVTIGNPIVSVNSPTICNGQNGTLTAAGAGSYVWSTGAIINPIIVSPTTTTSYTVTGTTGSCTGTAVSTVTVNPVPVVTPEVNLTYCAGASVPLNSFVSTPAGATFTWTNSNTAIGLAASGSTSTPVFTAINATSAAITAIISITPTLAGCIGAVSTFTITVNPLPIVTTEANLTYCPGNAVPLNTFASIPSGATYTWTNSNTAIGLAASGSTSLPVFTATNSTSSAIIATITITPSFGGCVGLVSTFTITVNPSPTINAEPNLTYCAGNSVPANTFVSVPAGATYTWTNSNTAIGLAASGTTSVPVFTATNATLSPITATITITPILTGCGGIPISYTITVNPIPAITGAPSSNTYCTGVAVTATSVSGSVTGTTFAWTNSNTAIGLAAAGSGNVPAFTTTNTGTSAITGTITITPTANSCTGTPVTYTITVNPRPTVNAISNISQCVGTTIIGSSFASTPSGATFAWTNSNTAIGLGASGSTNYLSFIATNTGTTPITGLITVTPTIGLCTGTPLTYTITVNPIPVAVIVPGSISIPSGGSTGLLASGGTTYSWLPIAGLSCTTCNNPNASPAVTTTYTVTVTSNGCSSTATSTVTVITPCNVTIDYDLLNGTNSDSYFLGATLIANKNIRVNGIVNIDRSITFSNCNFIMVPSGAINARINILTGKMLTLNEKTHLFSCSVMWDGIYVPSGAILNCSGYTFIEDALNAVVSQNGGYFMIESCIFNKNWTNVDVQAYAGTHPGYIKNAVFTSRSIPFNAVPSTNYTVGDVKALLSTSSLASSNLRNPNSTSRTQLGVVATDVTDFTIGYDGLLLVASSTAFSALNVYDNVSRGIYLTRTNAKIYNSLFQNMPRATACVGCGTFNGTAIYSMGTTTGTNGIVVGGLSAYQANTFSNTYIGVDVNYYQSAKVIKNTITNSSTLSGGTLVGVGSQGVKILPSQNNTVEVSQNSITNCATGILINRNNVNSSYATSLKVNGNNPITADASGYCTNAILMSDLLAGPGSIPVTFEIKDNVITESTNCIFLQNVQNPSIPTVQYNIFNNSCKVRYAAFPTVTAGIKITGCTGLRVIQNHTNYNVNTAYLAGGNIKAYGIYLQNSTNMAVKCNLIERAGQSLVFDGTCISSTTSGNGIGITENTMRYAQDGFVLLSSSSEIGQQGQSVTPALASNNYWDMSTTPNFLSSQTWSAPSTVNTFSKLYVNNTTGGFLATRPLSNFGPNPYAFGTGINITAAPAPGCSGTPPPAFMAGGNGSSATLEAVAENATVFPVYNEETHWQQDEFVYDEIKNTPEYTNNEDLSDFYDNNQLTSLGAFSEVDDEINSGNYTVAGVTNNNVNAVKIPEINKKAVNTIILLQLGNPAYVYSAADSAKLYSIANQCPLSGGNAVYQARHILMVIESNVIEFADNCETGDRRSVAISASSAEQSLYKLYPNPNNGSMILEYTINETDKAEMKIFDISGKFIRSYSLNPASNQLILNEDKLNNGAYFYQVRVNNQLVKSDKLIIIK